MVNRRISATSLQPEGLSPPAQGFALGCEVFPTSEPFRLEGISILKTQAGGLGWRRQPFGLEENVTPDMTTVAADPLQSAFVYSLHTPGRIVSHEVPP